MHTTTQTHIHTLSLTQTHTHTHTHSCIHKCMHTNTHTHTQAQTHTRFLYKSSGFCERVLVNWTTDQSIWRLTDIAGGVVLLRTAAGVRGVGRLHLTVLQQARVVGAVVLNLEEKLTAKTSLARVYVRTAKCSSRWICLHNCTCYHIETEVADQTCCLTQLQ